jgi:mono/diheme cytochrome c family protein
MSTAEMGEKRLWSRLTRTLLPKLLRGAGVLLVLGAIGLAWLHVKIRRALPPVVLPEYVALDTVLWLDQGWTPDDWQWYYHASQGGSMELPIPYSWIMNLERPEIPLLVFTKVGRLMEPEYMSRFGFLANPVRSYDVDGLSDGWAAPAGLSRLVEDQLNNPDSLPVGFVRTREYPDRRYRAPDGSTGRVIDEVVGFNCSACHTGQLNYQGTGIRIEGGAAMIELGMFRNAVGGALGLAANLPTRFKRFATAVLGEDHTDEEAELLKHQMEDLIRRGEALKEIEDERGIYPTWEGFSRLDAVGRIGNYVLGEEISLDNLAVSDAPVNFPHIWDTPWFDWVQYNASFKLPIVRNAGEAMGVFAAVNFDDVDEPDSLFQSTMALGNLYEMEALIRGDERYAGLRAPTWPEDILGEIDQDLAVEGEGLYIRHCQRCHLPPFNNRDAFLADSLWRVDADTSSLTRPQHSYLETRKLGLFEIGTDSNAAMNMINRTARLGPLAEVMLGDSVSGDTDVPFVTALGAAILNVVAVKYDSLGLSPEVRLAVSGDRSDPPAQAEPQYKARPLNGVWATPPFLHNGSVQNIYQLLGPEEERDSTFWLGTKEYDPVHLGYVSGRVRDGFLFDTGLTGNSNKGHHFTGDSASWQNGEMGVIGPSLSPKDRMAIIEFLKAMPPVPRGM